MYFLCGNHRQSLIQLPEKDISGYWMDWMLQAGENYEIKNWHKAKLFAGSAMDLATSALLRKDIKHADMAIQATLATIYTMNCFQQTQEPEHADHALELLTQRIVFAMHNTGSQEWARTCLAALENPIAQADFFQSYMTLPLIAAKSAKITKTSYANNVVSLH